MILQAFALLDTKTGIHHAPWFMAHFGAAIRAVQDLASDMDTVVGRHPADYCLMELGTFDDQTGRLEPCAPRSLGTAVSFLRTNQPGLGFTEEGEQPAIRV